MSKTIVEYCSNCEQLARELGRLKEQLAKSKEEKGEPFLSKQVADLKRELATTKAAGNMLREALKWLSFAYKEWSGKDLPKCEGALDTWRKAVKGKDK